MCDFPRLIKPIAAGIRAEEEEVGKAAVEVQLHGSCATLAKKMQSPGMVSFLPQSFCMLPVLSAKEDGNAAQSQLRPPLQRRMGPGKALRQQAMEQADCYLQGGVSSKTSSIKLWAKPPIKISCCFFLLLQLFIEAGHRSRKVPKGYLPLSHQLCHKTPWSISRTKDVRK